MLITTADRQLIAQARQLADARTPDDLRAYLASIGSSYATDKDSATIYAACLGNAQSLLTSLIAITDEADGA